jgi:hypothetical protein
MTAIDDWIADLQRNTYSLQDQNLISKVATVVAALELIEGGLAPGGPFLPLAGGTMTGAIIGADGSDWSSTGLSMSKTFTADDGSTWATSGITMAAGKTITPASVAGVVGTTTNDNAQAGSFGEYLSTDLPIGTPTTLANSTPKTAVTLPLTAGDWDVTFVGGFVFTAATVTACVASTSLGNNTIDTTLGRFAQSNLTSVGSGSNEALCVASRRFSLSASTNIFGVLDCVFSAGSVGGFGNISARRMR